MNPCLSGRTKVHEFWVGRLRVHVPQVVTLARDAAQLGEPQLRPGADRNTLEAQRGHFLKGVPSPNEAGSFHASLRECTPIKKDMKYPMRTTQSVGSPFAQPSPNRPLTVP